MKTPQERIKDLKTNYEKLDQEHGRLLGVIEDALNELTEPRWSEEGDN